MGIAARIRPRRTLTGPELPPELPRLAAAVEDGEVDDDHIKAVCTALDTLPAVVPADKKDICERILVRHAKSQDATFVTAIGKGIAEHLNPDDLFDDTDRARRRGLTLGPQQPDGMSRLSGWIDPEARAYLEAVRAAVRPGRHQPHTDDHDHHDVGSQSEDRAPESHDHEFASDGHHEGHPQTHDHDDVHPDADGHCEVKPDPRSAPQRLHDAVKMGLRAAISTGAYGQHRGIPVTVIATTTLGELDQAAHAVTNAAIAMPPPARTGGGSALPMRDLIRLAANALHYLAVFDDHTGRPLYLGRTKRVATADQRIICYARDRGCTRPGCTEPGYHCETHHDPPWAGGGRTDADCLFFGCGPDHTLLSKNILQTKITDTGRLAWTDGTGPPEVNLAHHPDQLLAELYKNDQD
jgi:hypothetical protein